ncbi:MAG TPA: alcohol dehydrogenase catalytic domain-containing protein [Clostridiales bacterium]|nr:alcohol dehydrogenase catalytic domain-containing protein [Clostridiales bacterium]
MTNNQDINGGSEHMKVAVYEGVRSIRFEDRPKPQAGAGEVVVQVKYCGICGTDIHAYMHEGILFPETVPGHETVGIIEEIGSGVEGFNIGDRVAVGAPGSCPEQCYYCRTGRPNLCVNGFGRTLGIGPGTQGAFAEYVLAKYPNRQLVRIPDNVRLEDAVLFDIFSTAYHGYRRSNFKAGNNVIVIGAGAIGLSVIQILKLSGAKNIVALDKSESKRRLAIEHGADLALDPGAEPKLKDNIKKLFNGLGADIVYECAGNPATVGIAVDLCRAGGEVILIGTNPEPLATINEIQIGLFELDLKGSFAYDDNELGTVLDFMSKGFIKTDGMVNKMLKLEEVKTALEELSETTEPVRYVISF